MRFDKMEPQDRRPNGYSCQLQIALVRFNLLRTQNDRLRDMFPESSANHHLTPSASDREFPFLERNKP